MTSRDFVEVLDYIDQKSNEIENVNVYRVHSSYDPKSSKIGKVTLKVNYTKDGKPLPLILNGKLPKNVVQRSVQFRGDECDKENIKNWIDSFIEEKRV